MGAENINLGTCKISLDGTDMGLTIGGVEVEASTNTHPTQVDQFGETIVAEHITGRNVVVKCPLAETTLENMAKVLPGATLITDGIDPLKKKVEVKTGVGINLLTTAKELVLHPIALPDADKSQDFVVPLAAAAGSINFAYKVNEERVYMAEFKGYPDADGVLFIYGDQTAQA